MHLLKCLVLWGALRVEAQKRPGSEWGEGGLRPAPKSGGGSGNSTAQSGLHERMECYKTCVAGDKTNQQCREECKDKGQPSAGGGSSGGQVGGNAGGQVGGNGPERSGESEDTKMRREIEEDAALAVADAMKLCRGNGNTFKQCCYDDTVMTSLADAVGKSKAQVTAKMVKDFALRAARILAPVLIAQCKEKGGSNCVQNVATKLRQLLGDDVDKTQAAKLMREGAQEEVFKTLRECAREDMATCEESAKKRLAALEGVDPSKINKYRLKDDGKKAAYRMLLQAIKSCNEDSELNEVGKKQCLKDARSVLKDPSKDANKEPKGREVQAALKRAAATIVRETMELCEAGQEAQCRADIKEQLKAIYGKEVSSVELGETEQQGALDAAEEQLRACKDAADSSSSCATAALEKLRKVRGNNAGGAKDGELKRELAKSMLIRERETCMQEETKESVESCLTSLAESIKDALKDLDSGSGDAEKKQKRLKKMQKEAVTSVIGHAYFNCLKAAKAAKEDAGEQFTEDDRKVGKKNCTEDAEGLREKATEEKLTHVLSRAASNKVATAMAECEGNFQDCMQEVKAMVKDLGLAGTREFRKFVRMGLSKLVGEWLATCQDEGKTQDACIGEAKTRFKSKFNADDAAFQALVEKIKEMAKTVRDGIDTQLVEMPELEVELGAGENSVCDAAKLDALKMELADAMDTSVTEKPVGGNWSAADLDKGPCFVSELRARYPFKANLTQATRQHLKGKAEEIAEEIYDHFKSKTEAAVRRLKEMDDISEVYAWQTVEEQAANVGGVTDTAAGSSICLVTLFLVLLRVA